MKLSEIYQSDFEISSKKNDKGRLDAAVAALFKDAGFDASDDEIKKMAQTFNVPGKYLHQAYKKIVDHGKDED